MGLFDRFKKKEEPAVSFDDNDIIAPVVGKMIPASEISDPVFGEEMMGQTIGFIPDGGDVACPVNGSVVVMFPTGHAFGIKGNDGNSYLVHIGIDTVSMNGKGFKPFIKQGDTVKAGQKAVQVDWNEVKKQGYQTTTMLIVTEPKEENFKNSYIPFGTVEKNQKINN